jgi:hypothetical protein
LNTDNCDALATCANTGGGFTCTCPSGYADTNGNGTLCTNVDECALGTDDCHADAICTDNDGSFDCACNDGYYGDGVTSCDLVENCDDILDVDASAPSGIYTIDPGTGAIETYCDMTTEGGGWTLALKANGANTTFNYASTLWTTNTLLNASSTDFDHTEAKLDVFNTVPFTEILVIMEYPVPGTSRSLVIEHDADNLLSVFSPDTYLAFDEPAGRAAWKTLMGPTSSLQLNCNREGFNANSSAGASRARIGIIGNQENDCNSPDSFIGVGTQNSPCFAGTAPSVGNSAGCSPDNGNVHLPAFAWVFVRGNVETFTYTDTAADDVAATALFDFFSSLSPDAGDFMFLSVDGGANGGAWCSERADWYVNEYLTQAVSGTMATSGSWNKWSRSTAGSWSSPTTQSFPNYFGYCDGTQYSWCSEWGHGDRYLALMPGQLGPEGESYAGNWSSGANWVVTVNVGSTRRGTCGF